MNFFLSIEIDNMARYIDFFVFFFKEQSRGKASRQANYEATGAAKAS
jgi:hypothetical protein